VCGCPQVGVHVCQTAVMAAAVLAASCVEHITTAAVKRGKLHAASSVAVTGLKWWQGYWSILGRA
jgi:hypothetical protein